MSIVQSPQVKQILLEMSHASEALSQSGVSSPEYAGAIASLRALQQQSDPNVFDTAQQIFEEERSRHQSASPNHYEVPPGKSVGDYSSLAKQYAAGFQDFMSRVLNCPVVTDDTACEGHRIISIPFSQNLGAGECNPWMESVLKDLKDLSNAAPENAVLLESLKKTMSKVPKAAAAKIKPEKFHSVVTSQAFKDMLVVQGGFEGPVSVGFGQGWYHLEIPKRPDEIKVANFADYAIQEGRYRPPSGLIARFAVDIAGRPIDIDLSSEPHVLIVGMTGSGKDMVLKCIAWDLMNNYSPAEFKLVTVDHQGLGVGRLSQTPWSWRGGDNISTFDEYEKLFVEIEIECLRRMEEFKQWDVEDIDDYNDSATRRGARIMPRIVVMVTEMMHFMVNDQTPVAKSRRDRMVAQARKFGIHFIFSSQRPFGVIGPAIRSEFGNVVSLRLQVAKDSEELFGTTRALELGKKGDGLYKRAEDVDARRIQTLYISKQTYKAVWKSLQSDDIASQWKEETAHGTIFIHPEMYDEFLGKKKDKDSESKKAA